ncbi:MAG: hypothetical protein NT106_04730 [Candidatus Sumerlaeota bacterium]|nr:hypothetical protein [Candidatus Sumerlaeota bacterium]
MPREEIKIIIKKNGEVWVDLGGLAPVRLRNYRELFEEMLGPIKGELAGMDGGTPGGVYLAETPEAEEDEKDKRRIRGT